MKKTRHNWQQVTGRVVVITKDRPDDAVEAMDNPDTLQQRRQHELERRAHIAESSIPELVDKANTLAGTEERKRLKKLSEFRTKPQSIASNEISDRKYHKRSQVEEYHERGEITCRPSSKTDKKVNSYFAAKSRTPR